MGNQPSDQQNNRDLSRNELSVRDFSNCRLFIPSVYSYSLLFCIFDMLQVIPEIRIIIVGLISILKTNVSIACGQTHTLLLTENGEVFSWGSHFRNKQVPESSRNIPCEISGPATSVSMISSGENYSLILTTNNDLYTSHEGKNFEKVDYLNDSTISQISCGLRHSLVLTTDNRLYSFRIKDDFIEAGLFEKNSFFLPPHLETKLKGKIIKQIASGYYFSLVLTMEGEVYSWKDNAYKSIGNSIIIPIKHLPRNIKMISCGGKHHSMALTDDGKAYYWRTSSNSSSIPLEIHFSNRIKMISCGSNHSLALSIDGKVYSWGKHGYGALGVGFEGSERGEISQLRKIQQPHEPRYTLVLLNENINLISSGFSFSVAITNDGKIYSWGINSVGQLGFGVNGGSAMSMPECHYTPIRVFIPKIK